MVLVKKQNEQPSTAAMDEEGLRSQEKIVHV